MARDVAAETFTVAWRRMEQLPAEPLPWLYGVARRVLANELRSQHRRDRLTSRIELAASVAGVPTVQPDHALEVTTSAHIRATIAKLSPRDQEVLQLIAWEDLECAGRGWQIISCATEMPSVFPLTCWTSGMPPYATADPCRAVAYDDPRVLVVVATARTEGVVADEVTDGDAAVER